MSGLWIVTDPGVPAAEVGAPRGPGRPGGPRGRGGPAPGRGWRCRRSSRCRAAGSRGRSGPSSGGGYGLARRPSRAYGQGCAMAAEIATASAVIEELEASLQGDVVAPASPDYDERRRIWNGSIDRAPASIARCADAARRRRGGPGRARGGPADRGPGRRAQLPRATRPATAGSSSTSRRCGRSASIPRRRRRPCRPGCCSASSIGRPRSTGLRSRPGSSPTPGWRASPSAAGSDG